MVEGTVWPERSDLALMGITSQVITLVEATVFAFLAAERHGLVPK